MDFLKPAEKRPIHVQVGEHLKENGLQKGWFAKKINVSPGYLSHLLANSRPITPALLSRINAVLNTNFSL